MNFILRILIVGISSYYIPSILPWWTIIIIPFILGCLFDDNYLSHFLSGFIGTGVAWIFIILSIDFNTQSILSEKIIKILEVDSVNYIIILISVVGGIVSGLGMITGYTLRRIFINEKDNRDFKFN
tara:strand:- start:15824 stop:16201 length:378 start_codon:yes stop_codon:yes gene_type:complete